MKKLRLRMMNAGIMVLIFSGCVFAQHGMMHGDGSAGGPERAYQGPIDKSHAKSILENYLDTVDSQNLKLGGIEEAGSIFVVDIVTKDGELVNRMQINKQTGQIDHYGEGYHRYRRCGASGGAGCPGKWKYCPYCGRKFHNRGSGKTMMHHDGGPDMMMPGYGRKHTGLKPGDSVDMETARQIVLDYLSASNNPNLKLGEIKEKQEGFKATIVTEKNEDLVDVIMVEKHSGHMHSMY